MKARTAERRECTRAPAAHRVVLRSRRGRVLGRGRTANVSEAGVFALVSLPNGQLPGERVVADLTVPDPSGTRGKRNSRRTVTYLCRVVRTGKMGHLTGVALEFVEKLA